jgi:hypothetical protein
MRKYYSYFGFYGYFSKARASLLMRDPNQAE